MVALVAFAIPTIRAASQRADSIVLEGRIERLVAVLEGGLPAYRTAVESSADLGNPEVPVRIRDASGTTLYARGDMDR
ncbi:MAG TPA: hypothetical protein VGG28_23650, partial [Kofleriaceae bacterium]